MAKKPACFKEKNLKGLLPKETKEKKKKVKGLSIEFHLLGIVGFV